MAIPGLGLAIALLVELFLGCFLDPTFGITVVSGGDIHLAFSQECS